MSPSRQNSLVPLLASLAVGAILAGAGLALAVDAPQSALGATGGASDVSVAPPADVAPSTAVPPTLDVPPTGGVPPTVEVAPTADVVPQPLPTMAVPDRALNSVLPRTQPLTQPPTPPKATPTDTQRSEAAPADAQVPTQSAQPVPADTTGAVIAATNAERMSAGCPALRVDDRLNTAAQLHSVDMADRRSMSHIGGDGSTFTDRLRAAGYPRPGAENIAAGQPTAASVVAAWMASSGHRRNILNCEYMAIGVGFDPRGNYWTQDFGR